MNAVNQWTLSLPVTESPPGNLNKITGNALTLLSIAGLAFTVTLILFWLMSLVIAQTGEAPTKRPPYVAIDAVFNEKEIEMHTAKKLPQPPKMLEPPRVPSRGLEPNESASSQGIGFYCLIFAITN